MTPPPPTPPSPSPYPGSPAPSVAGDGPPVPPAPPAPDARGAGGAGGGGREGGGGRSYKSTLNLPQTTFPMKANLVQNEPASIKRWGSIGGPGKGGLYARIRERRVAALEPGGKGGFVFHDGPPYANASIHLGHLFNKTLKDLVTRSKTMMGLDCPFVPGWDCHGLPIEHKVMTELVESGKVEKIRTLAEGDRRMAVRRECRRHAEKYQKLHTEQMTRLLTLADYEHPYLTMQPAYEGATLEVLAAMMERGLVYRALKPVHWSIANETALAEAELEYEDREDIAVYVDFEAADGEAVYDAFGLPPHAGDEVEEEGEEGEVAEGGGEGEEAKEPGPLARAGRRPHHRPSFMIWTTTPWTLPANVAVAVNPEHEYSLVFVDGNITVIASSLVQRVTKAAKAEEVEVLAAAMGSKLLGLRYRHPFIEAPPTPGEPGSQERGDPARAFTVVGADYVTLEDGTGLVHTAPGHGADDYTTGLRERLPIYCPVKGDGTYDATAPEWLLGRSVWDANGAVTEELRDSGHLFYDHKFTHSYPHDWRSKTPTIFRCTEQWFVDVKKEFLTKHEEEKHPDWPPEGLRKRALDCVLLELHEKPASPAQAKQIEEVVEAFQDADDAYSPAQSTKQPGEPFSPTTKALLKQIDFRAGRPQPIDFVPKWGANRMRGMLESRPDWCISRQRSWGLPIPAFFTPDGKPFMTAASVRAVAAAVREKGSDLWFQGSPADLLKGYDPAADPDPSATGVDLSTLKKGNDIFDVWFEAGSSWHACMQERADRAPTDGPSGGFPIDLYLEGSDQHRGWFQLSLLPALGATGRPPFKTILTHGFMVNKEGRKLSKSSGDSVDDLFQKHGADVLRWWVSTLAYENDVKTDEEFFRLAGEAYRKVRNTIRFMLSNLSDFTPPSPAASPDATDTTSPSPTSLDAWVLDQFNDLSAAVITAYNAFDFKGVSARLYDFCNDALSGVYLDAVKDRLYCDAKDAPRRRATQAALFGLTDGLCRLLAPILPHTADEAYRALYKVAPGDADRCVHLETFLPAFPVRADKAWPQVLTGRAHAQIALERAKADLGVENPLDAEIVLPDVEGNLARFNPVDLADLLGVSRITLDPNAVVPRVLDLRGEPRCERSWKRDGTVKPRSDGGMLTDRDARAIGLV